MPISFGQWDIIQTLFWPSAKRFGQPLLHICTQHMFTLQFGVLVNSRVPYILKKYALYKAIKNSL